MSMLSFCRSRAMSIFLSFTHQPLRKRFLLGVRYHELTSHIPYPLYVLVTTAHQFLQSVSGQVQHQAQTPELHHTCTLSLRPCKTSAGTVDSRFISWDRGSSCCIICANRETVLLNSCSFSTMSIAVCDKTLRCRLRSVWATDETRAASVGVSGSDQISASEKRVSWSTELVDHPPSRDIPSTLMPAYGSSSSFLRLPFLKIARRLPTCPNYRHKTCA